MIDAALQIATALAAAVVLARAEPALNRMTARTPQLVRIALVLLVAGAAAKLGAILLLGAVPSAPEALTAAGLALLLLCERRLRVLVPPGRPARPSGGFPE